MRISKHACSKVSHRPGCWTCLLASDWLLQTSTSEYKMRGDKKKKVTILFKFCKTILYCYTKETQPNTTDVGTGWRQCCQHGNFHAQVADFWTSHDNFFCCELLSINPATFPETFLRLFCYFEHESKYLSLALPVLKSKKALGAVRYFFELKHTKLFLTICSRSRWKSEITSALIFFVFLSSLICIM